ncbi:MAG TPA: Zn-ribbon domain-containing OB-fold protein [Dehalococcoidia bacterium]|nr:Zn-ribbon domain-containing OB-fold protein [Dehalococcoidia bacterium]
MLQNNRGVTEMEDEPLVVEGKLEIPFKYYAGAQASKFFIELRDNKKILGVKCPRCDKVYFPPRTTCTWCFSRLDELVELGTRGELLSYTVVHYSEPVHPVKAPFVYGVVKLDGADTGLAHLIGEVNLDELKIGMRVEAVFKKEREGNILDIEYFKPV